MVRSRMNSCTRWPAKALCASKASGRASSCKGQGQGVRSWPSSAGQAWVNSRCCAGVRQGRSVALQFHPELDPALLELWLDDDREAGEAVLVGCTHDQLRSRTAELHDDAALRIRRLVQGFLTYTARQPCPSS